MTVKFQYEPAYGKLADFLETVGRRKYIKPIYEELEDSARSRSGAADLQGSASAIPSDRPNDGGWDSQVDVVGYTENYDTRGPIAQLVRALP